MFAVLLHALTEQFKLNLILLSDFLNHTKIFNLHWLTKLYNRGKFYLTARQVNYVLIRLNQSNEPADMFILLL